MGASGCRRTLCLLLLFGVRMVTGTTNAITKKNENNHIATPSFVRDSQRQLQNADPLFCSSIVTDEDGFVVCQVTTDHVWNTESVILITPTTVRTGEDVNRPVVPTQTITALHIQQGTSLSCQRDFCELAIRGFDSIRVDGTLLGSKISLQSLGDIAMDTSNGLIDTVGRGYGSQQGPGAGFITGGGVLTSCSAHNRIAASHGGVGGRYCINTPPNLAPTYDLSATDFGSGGSSSCNGEASFGGGVVDLVAETTISIASGSRILANAAPSFCVGGCSGGSGGSIRLTAESIVGSGSIMANGGGASASGGGGRIIITADSFQRSNFLIQADGGDIPETEECVEAIGSDGTIVVQCKTSTCFNEGFPVGGGQCGCTCIEPWAGKDCTECTQTCRNDGTVNDASCTCDCPDEWTGERCLSCNADFLCNGNGRCSVDNTGDTTSFGCDCDTHFFGVECETFCNRDITCTSNGLCSEDGRTCICATGKVGDDCFCDEQPPEVCASGGACSGNGICQNRECFCGPGWVGCHCDIPCDSETDCSGHGQCNPRDGTCDCDAGFTGPNCVQDPNLYCSDPAQTKSGHPCIPGVLNVLGHGYDALEGSVKNPVIQLTFSQGRTFTLPPDKTYELPDDVTCTPITDTTSTFSTREFQSTSDFRFYLSTSVGLSAEFQAAYLSASAEYTTALERSFLQNRILHTSDLNHGLYECSLVDSVLVPNVASSASLAYDNLQGNRLIQSLGTHYVRSAVFGGRVSVFNYVESCVYSELTSDEVRVAVEAAAFELAGAPSASGSVDTYVGSTCSVYSKNAFFSKTVNGGDRALLIVPDAENNIQDFRDWFGSLDFTPGHIQLKLNPIDFVFVDLVEDVNGYVGGRTIVEYNQDESLSAAGIDGDPVACAAQCSTFSSANNRFAPNAFLWLFLTIVALAFLYFECAL